MGRNAQTCGLSWVKPGTITFQMIHILHLSCIKEVHFAAPPPTVADVL